MSKSFYRRIDIANHLGISRMQLHRMECIIPLPGSSNGQHCGFLSEKTIETWRHSVGHKVHNDAVRGLFLHPTRKAGRFVE